MDQIITFEKSLETRYREFEEVFSQLKILPYSKIQSEWTYYLELTLDPSGWQAIWKIPRCKCEEMNIDFPTVVLVFVVNVNFKSLSALIRILAVQDDIHLPEKHTVSLTQLWPTKEQDKSIGLNLNSTANALDMLRFFYIYLLMPWDEDEDISDWKGSHLVSRLTLHYDLKTGKIPKGTAEHIYALLNEARRLNTKRQLLVNVCGEIDSDIEEENGNSNKSVDNLIEINVRLIEIQNEISLFENQLFRKVLVKRQQSMELTTKGNKEKSQIWLICKEAKASEYITFLKTVEEMYPNDHLTFATDLMTKLESANLNDTFLLDQNEHNIKCEGALMENFLIKGIGLRDNIKIVSFAEEVMFDCIGESTVIENVTFNSRKTQCAILIRKGHVKIKNCKFISDQSTTSHQGIFVSNSARLTLIDCEISGFSVAVIGESGSEIDIKNTLIRDVSIGIKASDDCKLGLYNSTIKDCKEYGIVMEMKEDLSSENVGGFEILDAISQIKYESISFSNNGKGDVTIRKSIKVMDNLFVNPDLDLTVLESSDDEMETSQCSNLNDTVLEKKVSCEEIVA